MTLEQSYESYEWFRKVERQLAPSATELPATLGDFILRWGDPPLRKIVGPESGDVSDNDLVTVLGQVDSLRGDLFGEVRELEELIPTDPTLGDFADVAVAAFERSLLFPGGRTQLLMFGPDNPERRVKQLAEAFMGAETHLLTTLGIRFSAAHRIVTQGGNPRRLLLPREEDMSLRFSEVTSTSNFISLRDQWTDSWDALLPIALAAGSRRAIRALIRMGKLRAAAQVVLEADGFVTSPFGRLSEATALANEYFTIALDMIALVTLDESLVDDDAGDFGSGTP